jgi:membrane protein required for colicin V production
VTGFDYAVLIILGISMLLGFWRGIVGEVLALAAWVVGFLAARAWAEPVGRLLSGEPALRYGLGFVLVLVGVLVVFALGRLLMRLLLKAVGLGLLDRILGAVFGVVRGAMVVFVVVLLAGLTALPKAVSWQEATLVPPFETAAIASKPWLPPEMAVRIHYR